MSQIWSGLLSLITKSYTLLPQDLILAYNWLRWSGDQNNGLWLVNVSPYCFLIGWCRWPVSWPTQSDDIYQKTTYLVRLGLVLFHNKVNFKEFMSRYRRQFGSNLHHLHHNISFFFWPDLIQYSGWRQVRWFQLADSKLREKIAFQFQLSETYFSQKRWLGNTENFLLDSDWYFLRQQCCYYAHYHII